jgi:hypothetical protein
MALQELTKAQAKWRQAALARLERLKAIAKQYEEEGEDVTTPLPEVFQVAEALLKLIAAECNFQLPEPNMVISANGSIGVRFSFQGSSDEANILDIEFTNDRKVDVYARVTVGKSKPQKISKPNTIPEELRKLAS